MSDPSDPNLDPAPVVPVEPEVPVVPEPEPVELVEPQPEPSPEPAARGSIPQRRVDTYAQRAREAEARAARFERMVEALIAQGPQAKPAAPEPPAPTIEPLPPRPRRENYADPDAYDAAMDEYGDKKLARQLAIARAEDEQHQKAVAEQRQREAQEQDHRVAIQRREESWAQRMAKAEAEEPEWFDAFETVGPNITPFMGDAIKRSDNGVAVVMYLHKNPEVRQRIASLTDPVSALLEMGRIEAQLTRPEPVVRAPTTPPMRPVGRGSAGTPARDIYSVGNDPGNKDYFTMRQEQIAAANRSRH